MITLNTHKIKISYSLLISVLLHLATFIALGLSIDFSSKTLLGNTKEEVLNSYLFNENSSQTAAITQNQVKKLIDKSVMPEKMLQKNKKTLMSPQSTYTQQNKPSSTRHSNISQGEQTEALIALLHTAIQNQQHYPPSAIQMEREGRITLAFILYANGTISDLRIVKSSHTNSLDDAAIAAVRDAAPFQAVKKYLKEPQEYSIDVVFELT